MQKSPAKDCQIRCLLACPRSGSALLMRIFAESPDCAITSYLFHDEDANSVTERSSDFSIFQDPSYCEIIQRASHEGRQFLISKEDLGRSIETDGRLHQLLLGQSAYAMTRTVFLIRDPIRVFDSWKHLGWKDTQSLIDSWSGLFRALERAEPKLIHRVLYEKLVRQPSKEVENICVFWGVPFSTGMLEFSAPFGLSFLFKSSAQRKAYDQPQPPGLFSTVEKEFTIVMDVPAHGVLTNEEKTKIENELGPLYLSCWVDCISQLGNHLAEKKWIGFDLDDTLHEFRRASSAASDRVLQSMHETFGIPLAALRSQYREILRKATSSAFVDGKKSSEYRAERFVAVAKHFSLSLEDERSGLPHLLSLYETTLRQNLELKSGALSLLKAIKGLGKKIVIITEGPQDAQEWTIKNLGISSYVDFLATTNQFNVSKTEGLFPKVLRALSISPLEMAYVGDNADRDMKPAMAEGIFSFHLRTGTVT